MAWAFIDDVTADRGNSVNSEVYKVILSAQIYTTKTAKVIQQCFTCANNDPKHTVKSDPRVSQGKEMGYLSVCQLVI